MDGLPISNYVLDEFVSQDLSKLTACAPKSLDADFPDRKNWFSQFVLRRIFHNHVAGEKAGLALVLVRRTDAALDEWELACATAKENLHQPSAYFKLLRHLENCISSLCQGFKLSRRAIEKELFKKGDGSVYERLNWVYNVSRHFDPKALPVGDLHRVWVTNDGVHTREHAVSFDEIREKIKSLAVVVERFAGEATASE